MGGFEILGLIARLTPLPCKTRAKSTVGYETVKESNRSVKAAKYNTSLSL